MDSPYKKTAPRVSAEIGRRLTQLRLARNVTQKTLAREAGIGLRTLRRLEAGQPTSLDSFLRTALALGLGDALLVALPSHGIRPIERVERRGAERRRARPKRAEASNAPWTWNQPSRD
ncbi:MAG: helix-turn-helix transcriptional regulator [Gammaproteobacteria bacterium]|nr:helix-turn-helix transcriptional regulator [Gammaproteobacteria bacterium]